MVNIQEKYATLLKNSCYAYCLCYLFDIERDEWSWLEHIAVGVKAKAIDEDCYINDPCKFINILTGDTKYKNVKKVKITNILDLPKNQKYIVEYNWIRGSHFVVVENGKVIFDPSGESESVKNGKPVSFRLFY